MTGASAETEHFRCKLMEKGFTWLILKGLQSMAGLESAGHTVSL